MKTEQHTNTIQGNMQGEKVAMGVQMDDMSHIMGILTDLYKDRLFAVIREYSTNAIDAHIEAGVSLPIEVTLPTVLTPYLKIRDYGTGLDRDGIREVYSQYGRSTKRNTNEQTGMLGLGCKSALTYTQQFTVTSVKNGQRVTVMVSRDEEGAGHMQIVADEPTSDANGTEVMVAIQRGDHWRAEELTQGLFKFWQKGTVTVNGKEPVRFDADESILKLSDTLYLDKSAEFSDDTVVMGGVAYKQKLDIGINRNYHTSNFALIAFVPIGSVKPTPSREALMDTTLTKGTLDAIKPAFQVAIEGAIQREIDKAANPRDAIRVILAWANLIPTGSKQAVPYTYKGKTLPGGYETADEDGKRLIISGANSGKQSENREAINWPIDNWPGTVWVENYKPTVFSAQHKKKLNKWTKDAGLVLGNYRYNGGTPAADNEVRNYVMLPGKAPKSEFIADTHIVDWETVRAIRIDPPARMIGGSYKARVSGSFDVVTETGVEYEVPGDKIRQDKPILWVHGNTHNGRVYSEAVAGVYKKFTIVCLPGNRIGKFCREVTKAVPVLDAIKAGYEKWKAAISDTDKLSMAYNDHNLVGTYSRINANKVDDPDIKAAVVAAKRDVTNLLTQRRAMTRICDPYASNSTKKPANPLAKYPLVYGGAYQQRSSWDDHAYFYVNAAYAAMKNGSL